MKKKEDIKKHLNGERRALIPANILSFFLLFIFSPGIIFSQLNINGFGRTDTYKSLPGFSNIIKINFNEDDYSDLMLFDPLQQGFLLHKGEKDNKFSKPIDKFFFYSISNFKYFQSRETQQDLYLFVSRSERVTGLTSFTKYGTLQLLNLKKLNSYPSNITVADIDQDGTNEGLISGPAYNGMSILYLNKLSLRQKNIFNGRSFQCAEFIDLNLDSYPDIAAIDLLENSIKLFFNNSEGNFSESRTISYFGKLDELKICNLNNDEFMDISFIRNNELVVLLGDSISSFENKVEFAFPFKPFSYEVSDINNDGINDVVVHNQSKQRLEIYYLDWNYKLAKPQLIFTNVNISALALLQKGKAKRIAAVSAAGELYVAGKVINSQDHFRFSAGYMSNIYPQSSFTNFLIFGNKNDSPALSIITGNYSQRFQNITSIPLIYNYDKLFADDKGYGNYDFYLFSDKSLEIVSFSEFDFSTNKISFTPNALTIDIRTVEDRQIDSKYIHLLFKQKDVLGIENVELENNTAISQGIDIIDSNVVNAIISNGTFEEVHYWKLSDSSLTFNSVRQIEEIKIKFKSEEYVISPFTIPEIKLSFIDTINKNILSQVSYNGKSYFFVFDGEKIFRLPSKNPNINFILPKMLASAKAQKLNEYILYDKVSGYFKKVILNSKDKRLSITNYIESKDVNGYFVSSFFDGNYYLFYTNDKNNLLTIRKIE